MTDLRQAAHQALEALESSRVFVTTREKIKHPEGTEGYDERITALRTALEQQQAEPVSHAVIVGALFDFMGWLTTRKERLILSSTDNASPAADAIKDFAEMRGLLLDDAKVQDWQAYTTPPQQQAEPVASIYVSLDGAREFDDWKHELPVGRNFLYTAALQRKPLTDAEFCEQWLKQTGRIMGTDKQLLLQAKQVTEAAHGIKEGT